MQGWQRAGRPGAWAELRRRQTQTPGTLPPQPFGRQGGGRRHTGGAGEGGGAARLLSGFLPLGAAVTRRRRMWPEPSVSCLISRPLPGSPGRPTLQPKALPREGLAKEENHFSRLAGPSQAFLPHPCPRTSHRKWGRGPARPEVPTSGHSGSRPRDSCLSGDPHCPAACTWKPSGSKVNHFQEGSVCEPSHVLVRSHAWSLGLENWSLDPQAVHIPAPSQSASCPWTLSKGGGGLGRRDTRLAVREGSPGPSSCPALP